jgi:hypothetical protein
MRKAGISVRHRRRFGVTTEGRHRCSVAENLLDRQFDVASPNKALGERHHVPVDQPGFALLGRRHGSVLAPSGWLGAGRAHAPGAGCGRSNHGAEAAPTSTGPAALFRPRQPVAEWLRSLPANAQAVRHDPFDEPQRQLLGQFTRGAILWQPQTQVIRPQTVRHAPRSQGGGGRLHRDVLQLAAPPLHPRIHQSDGLGGQGECRIGRVSALTPPLHDTPARRDRRLDRGGLRQVARGRGGDLAGAWYGTSRARPGQ